MHHVVKNVTEIGFVDTEQHLHRLRGETDLVSNDHRASIDSTVDVDHLDCVRVVDREPRVCV
jgi:hypothetical protein